MGFVGLARNEVTFQPEAYMASLPESLVGRHVFVLDPMLATGGSAIRALDRLREVGARRLALVCLVAAPEGVAAVQEAHPDVTIWIAALDDRLDERGYIRPGLGDAGDRVFGTPA
jgi:uracil phosphoribosyltransferase